MSLRGPFLDGTADMKMGPPQDDRGCHKRGKTRVHACICVSGGRVGDETRAAVRKTATFRSVGILLAVQKKGLNAGASSARERLSVVEERD